MRIEQPQLLPAMDRVERVVDVERDPFRNRWKARPMRSKARASGRFSRREIVDCEHSSRSDGVRSSAILNMGSPRRLEASSPSS
jgi:hypothetical protein